MAAHGTFHLDVGEGLDIKLLEESDAGEMIALIDGSREELRKWLPWVDKTRTRNDSLVFIQSALDQHKNCTGLHAGIRLNDKLVGVIGYVNIDVNNRRAMIGYWLSTEYWGKGLATRACAAMVETAFKRLLLNRVEIYCAMDNHRSRAIPERLGFRREGVLRSHEWVNDHFVDLVTYGILAGEWPEQRKKLKR